MVTVDQSTAATKVHPCLEAFFSQQVPELFTTVVHENVIYRPDPFDFPSLHENARLTMQRLLHQVISGQATTGKNLLVSGGNGSGKTHLLRAIRTMTHEHSWGYCGYIRYYNPNSVAHETLNELIKSLDHQYCTTSSETGLQRLANRLLNTLKARTPIPQEECESLQDATLTAHEITNLVFRLADFAVQLPEFQSINLNFLRAILFLIPSDNRIRSRILGWLRCEELNTWDRQLIGDLVPRTEPQHALQMLVDFAKLIKILEKTALVLMIDQVDNLLDNDPPDQPGANLREALKTLLEFNSRCDNSIVVLSLIKVFHDPGQNLLGGWILDRLNADPAPIELIERLTPELLREMIRVRLSRFYEECGIEHLMPDSLFPYTEDDLKILQGKTIRDVLLALHRHREKCIQAQKLLLVVINPDVRTDYTDQWLKYQQHYQFNHRDDDAVLTQLLSDSIRSVSHELSGGMYFSTDDVDSTIIPTMRHVNNNVYKFYVALCDKSGRGGGLKNQVEHVIKLAGEIPIVFVRSTEFPVSAKAPVNQLMKTVLKPKKSGRKVVISNSDWNLLAAFREFAKLHARSPGFQEWQREAKPLSSCEALAKILDWENLPSPDPVPPPPPAPPPLPPPPTRSPSLLRIGLTRNALKTPVEIQPQEFTRHAAFLGSTGSGKTTAALTIVEQLLAQGVPAILIDRKGDLARYADPTAWNEPIDATLQARRAALRDQLDIQLFTPGTGDQGRHLAIPIVPPELGDVSENDREQLCNLAAAGLWKMMGYKNNSDQAKQVLLMHSLILLSQHTKQPVTIKNVYEMILQRDEALALKVQYDDRHYEKLTETLQTFMNLQRRLIEGHEVLDLNVLTGRDGSVPRGKTRLSIINTQFLDTDERLDFWVAQFLLSLYRWGSRYPSDQLQLVVLLDEADRYLPPVVKPATKQPLENLLMQARAKGIGLFLLTQNPGNFDYKCRELINTWLVGKITDQQSLTKLKGVFSVGANDPLAKAASQAVGEFCLAREGQTASILVDRNLVRTTVVPQQQILELARRTRQG